MSNQDLPRGKAIGELNGRWAFLFKATQTIVPLFIFAATVVGVPWCTWVTKAITAQATEIRSLQDWKAIGPRFTAVDADKLRLSVKQEIRDEMVEKLNEKLDNLRAEVIKTHTLLEQHTQQPPK